MKEQQPDQNQPAAQGGATPTAEPCILEEIAIEELAIDGICGVY